jgi:hypothetical protein
MKNNKFIELFKKSALTKAEFSRKCGIKKQNLNTYLIGKMEMKISTFEKIKKNYLRNI